MNNIVVVGGGIAGYTTALQLASKENSVTLIEKNILGGTCLNAGCIPVKLLGTLSTASKDPDYIFKEKDKIVKMLRSSIASLIAMKKITYIEDRAKILKDNSIELQTSRQKLPFDSLILAIGSKPLQPDTCEKKNLLTPDDLLHLTEVPSSLVIIGGGYIGIALAHIFHKLGSKITVLEKEQSILPQLPATATAIVAKAMEKNGMKITTGAEVISCTDREIICKDGRKITYDKVVIALGREANGIDSDIPLTYHNNFIQTDPYLQTNQENIYAIGDCTEGPLFAHKAEYDARLIASNLTARSKQMKHYESVPSIITSDPTIAYIGRSDEMKKIKMDFGNIGSSYCDDSTKGFIELYLDNDSIIHGGLVVNKNAQEIISALTPIIYGKMSCKDVTKMMWAHPTPSEIIKEAAKKAV